MKGHWDVTLYGRVTGKPYIYRTYMRKDTDPTKVINHAAFLHAEELNYGTAVSESEFTRNDKFALEWIEDD
jgi:hypothetical protein